MKNLMLLSSIVAAGAVFAAVDVDSTNSVGVLNISTSSKPVQQLIAVPFEGYETGDKISVTDLVAPNGIPNGTHLRAINEDGKTYATWQKDDSGWQPEAAIDISKDNAQEVAGIANTAGIITRGSSFWLDFTGVSKPDSVMILGKGKTGGSVALTQNKMNLIGNAAPTNFNLLASGVLSGAAAGDKIYVQKSGDSGALDIYTFLGGTNNVWRKVGALKDNVESLTLAPGEGCWYWAKNATAVNF